MTCEACGSLGGAADARCRACGHVFGAAVPDATAEHPVALEPTPAAPGDPAPEDDFEIVLKPREKSFGSSNGGARVPLAGTGSGPSKPLPGVAPRKPGLVIAFDDDQEPAPRTPVAQEPTRVMPNPGWAPPSSPVPVAAPSFPAPPAPWQPVGGSTLPAPAPPSGPPALPPAPPRSGGPGAWWSRPHLLGPFAALLLILIGVGTWMLLGRGSADERAAAALVQAGQTRVNDLSERAARASKLASLRDVGRGAADAASELEGREQDAATIGDEALRGQAVAMLAAQRSYLAGLSGLGGLNQSDLLNADRPKWSQTKSRIEQGALGIKTAQAPLAARELPGETAVDIATVEKTAGTIDEVVRSAAYALTQWNQKLRAYNGRLRAAERRAARIAEYRGAVRAVLATYATDRKAVDQFVEDVDDYDFTEYDDYDTASERVLGFMNDRRRSLADIQELAGRAPVGAQEDHDALVDPVYRSLDGLQSLSDAVDEAWQAEEPARSMPSWEAFEALNGDIAAKLEGSQQAWESRVEGLRVEARTAGVGTKPQRPDV